ncbi:MAG: hypothetical protein K9L59_00770 [Desulfobacterales bacterium]|nr:hypothetical protein [Desulfobacterales bacterium]MCF8078109.1 hypothetical protein [Desulfobacterales bacterium]
MAGKGRGGWLNRNVFAFGLASLLGDICHEMATAVLPQFMRAIGASTASLGAIEGVADAFSSFVKLGAGFHSDKIGHRKTWTVAGYALTAVAKALFAFGVLGVVNGIGDLVSSLAVGLLWTAIGAGWGFGYAAVVGLAGALWMATVPAKDR